MNINSQNLSFVSFEVHFGFRHSLLQIVADIVEQNLEGDKYILFKYCADVENCESFKGFGFIYILVANPCDARESC